MPTPSMCSSRRTPGRSCRRPMPDSIPPDRRFRYSDDELAALPEILKRLAQLLQNGVSGNSASVRTQVNTGCGDRSWPFRWPATHCKEYLVSGRHRGEIDAAKDRCSATRSGLPKNPVSKSRALRPSPVPKRSWNLRFRTKSPRKERASPHCPTTKASRPAKNISKISYRLFNIHSLRNGA